MTRSLTLALCLCFATLLTSHADAATLTVNAGGDLQAAINAAKPGDTILLQAGAVFSGTFKLPAKGGSTFITIRSSAPDASLPPAGTRITPASSGSLAKIRSTTGGSAIKTAAGASYWKLMFLEFYPSSSTSSADLVELGAADSTQSTQASVPQHLVIDRCYLHGDSGYGQRRGVALNSGDTQIINSYFSDFKGKTEDTQAIAGWNGPGPFLIENNYLEASGENIAFGGGDPDVPNLVPNNITIRRNLISKPLAWMSLSWTVKNLIELKNAENVLIDGNTIENNWAAGQQGYSILFTPRNQYGGAPWSVVKNITVQNNIIRHMSAVFNICGYDNLATSQQTQNIKVLNNLVYDISSSYEIPNHPANGLFAVIGAGPKDIVFDHNTVDSDGSQTISFYKGTTPTGWTIAGFVLTNNQLRDNKYGIFGDNSSPGTVSLNTYTPGAYVQANVIAGASAKTYPVGNDYPTIAQWLADFVNAGAANYQLVSSSPSNNAGTDGKDIGVDFTQLTAAMNGSGAADPPPPAASTPYTGTPISLPGTIEAENYDKGGEGIAYHDTTSGNSGGVYRSDDVDIRKSTDTGGGYNLKSVRGGEWLAYSVTVASAGSYTVSFRVASSGGGGTVHLTVDGANVTGSVALPNTGGWDTWQTVTKTGVTLPAGAHLLKLIVDADGSGGTVADINWIAVSSSSSGGSASTPFTGTPIALPGTIEAENYDVGGEGVAYHDTTPGNSGGVYRSNSVDIAKTSDSSGGYNLKSVRAGEWLAYSVSVAKSGSYTVDLRIASDGPGGAVHLTVDGTDVTGSNQLPDTGGWDTWKTVSKSGVALPSGNHVLRLFIDANGSGGTAADINWLAVH